MLKNELRYYMNKLSACDLSIKNKNVKIFLKKKFKEGETVDEFMKYVGDSEM